MSVANDVRKAIWSVDKDQPMWSVSSLEQIVARTFGQTTFVASLLSVFLMSPQPPGRGARRPGLRSIVEGFGFVRGRQAIQGAYLIDINAMVFGMPRALFPALATTVFGT